MAENFKHEAKLLNITDIIENSYNPNVMDERTFDLTVKNIEREGFIYPIVVKTPDKDGKYVIIDGYHRWKAANQLGYKQLPAIVLDKKTPDAMIATINFNKLRGEFDTLKLAEVIHTLMKEYSIEELEEKLGYSQSELEGLDSLREFDFNQYEKGEVDIDGGEEMARETKFELVLNVKQMKIVEEALKRTEKEDQAEALEAVCTHYLATTKAKPTEKKHG